MSLFLKNTYWSIRDKGQWNIQLTLFIVKEKDNEREWAKDTSSEFI